MNLFRKFLKTVPSAVELIFAILGALIVIMLGSLLLGADYPKPDPVMYVKERDNNKTLYVAIIATIVSPTILAFFSNRARRKDKQLDWDRQDKVALHAEKAAAAAAAAAEEVKKTLAKNELANSHTPAGIVDTTNKVHILTNNSMELALAANASSLKRIAKLTGDQVDAELAEEAERKLDEHRKKQAKVDSLPPIVS